MMSDQDDTLLDEDLGDEEYDLGNDEEEALLADDYEIDRQNSYKGEEETDDVLELGVTDALDDLDADDENNDYSNEDTNENPTDSYIDEQHRDCHINYYNQEDSRNYHEGNIKLYGEQGAMHYVTSDLREKLQKSIQKKVIIGEDQGIEDDEYDEAKERRNRFKNERTIVSPKINNEIPDSLENVVTADPMRMSFRGRGRGRGIRGARGVRFGGQIIGNCNPRYPARMPFDDQNSQFRPPLLEARPPIYSNVPSNQMNASIIYHQNSRNSHIPLQFQQFPHSVSPHPRPHFNEPRLPFNSNQFHSPLQTPRLQNPQMEFVPRVLMQHAPGSRYTGPQNPQVMLNQPRFQRPLHESEISSRAIVSHGPIMIHQNATMHPRHPSMHVQCHDGQMPVFRSSGPNQISQVQHPNGLLQHVFENHLPLQEPRNIYESRQVNNRPSLDQFNASGSQVAHHQTGSLIPHVPLAPGHKILINPHFRGNTQSTAEVRPSWETSHPLPRQSQLTTEEFRLQSGQYRGQQAPYNQQSCTQSLQKVPQDYEKKNSPHNKNDDPYAYFSDVWQENKTTKPPRSSTPTKLYSGEKNYSRDTGYRDHEKYKQNARDIYAEDQRYRDRSPQSRLRDQHHPQRSRPSQSNNDCRSDSHAQRSKSINPSNHPPLRAPQKRPPEAHDRIDCSINQKRVKNSTNVHDTRSTITQNDSVNSEKEEDMDPEMQEYKKKLEEQKRLREKILQEKENRRKQAAMKKQIDESKNIRNSDSQQESKLLVSRVKKETVDNRSQLSNKTKIRAENNQTEDGKAVGGRVMRTMINNNSHSNHSTARVLPEMNTDVPACSIWRDTRRVVMQKSITNERAATSLQKVISNIQKQLPNKRSLEDSQSVPLLTKIIKKIPLSVTKKPITVRKIANEQLENVRKVLINNSALESAKTTPKNRVVIQKPIQIKRTIDNKTNIVIVQNLSANTTETRIREMCHGIGTIENVMIDDGTATIAFKTHSAALVFHKKYQKKIIDLSMIDVRLVSQAENQMTVPSALS